MKQQKNDLIPFEKEILKSINVFNNTKYNYKNLMEWSSSEKTIRENLKEGEIVYNIMGVWVAINPES